MSTTVSNPYSFNIVNDTSFSGDVQAALSVTETLLVRTTYSGLLQINIPNGVNMLKIIFDDTSDFFEEDPPYGDLYNNSNKKILNSVKNISYLVEQERALCILYGLMTIIS